MIFSLAIIAGASLSFLPLGIFVRRLAIGRVTDVELPPLPSGSLARDEAVTPDLAIRQREFANRFRVVPQRDRGTDLQGGRA
jgi:hypothetical protein